MQTNLLNSRSIAGGNISISNSPKDLAGKDFLMARLMGITRGTHAPLPAMVFSWSAAPDIRYVTGRFLPICMSFASGYS
ncbi:MAG: hypothetical protein Q7V05_14975 [Methanoregula sp.]|nr:hypothetical protein [Methanoregula sp.]